MANIFGERGFVTIATGKNRYRKLAYNLLLSYKKNAGCSHPFALITDRKDHYSDAFDYTVIIDNPSNSYNDKLRLFEYLPFSETIFIDADSLIYSDITSWWEQFRAAGDFCAFGFAHRDLSGRYGWFRPSGMKEYASKINFVPAFNGGVYYMRNTDACRNVFNIAQNCASHYSDYAFKGFAKPADEPLLALGMAVCGFEPIPNERGSQVEYIFAPKRMRLDADILNGTARYHRDEKTVEGAIIHWSNYLTEKSCYQYEVYKLRTGHSSALAAALSRFYDLRAICCRIVRGIKRKVKNR